MLRKLETAQAQEREALQKSSASEFGQSFAQSAQNRRTPELTT